MFHATVIVTLRSSILDPQGKAVEHAMHALGYPAAAGVRMGKYVEFEIDVKTRKEAASIAQAVADKLLANPVMEDFRITLDEKKSPARAKKAAPKKKPAPKKGTRKK